MVKSNKSVYVHFVIVRYLEQELTDTLYSQFFKKRMKKTLLWLTH